MHYQIYIPSGAESRPSLASVGLSQLQENASQQEILGNGPDGGAGVLYTWTVPAGIYFGTRATWIRQHTGAYWVGILPEHPPNPGDLLRPNVFDGEELALGDGNLWRIAAAGRLPQVYRINAATGELEQEIRSQFREYFEECQRWFNLLLSIDSEKFQAMVPRDWWDFCLRALSQNYRICPEVASYLGLLDSTLLIQCAIAAVQGAQIKAAEQDLQKKSPEQPSLDETPHVVPGFAA